MVKSQADKVYLKDHIFEKLSEKREVSPEELPPNGRTLLKCDEPSSTRFVCSRRHLEGKHHGKVL